MGSAPAVADVARLPSIGAPVFSMRGEPWPRSPAVTQPARTSVAHKPANAASRRGLITSQLPVSSEAPAMLHTQARDGLFFGSNHSRQGFGPKYGGGKEENCR